VGWINKPFKIFPAQKYKNMNERIKVAVDKLIEMGWIEKNELVVGDALVLVIREEIAKASYREVMQFFNNP
jgi:hypothetical protein